MFFLIFYVIGQSGCGELLRYCPGKCSSACFEFRRDGENVAFGIGDIESGNKMCSAG